MERLTLASPGRASPLDSANGNAAAMAAGVMEIPHNVNDTLIRFRLLSALLDWGKVNL